MQCGGGGAGKRQNLRRRREILWGQLGDHDAAHPSLCITPDSTVKVYIVSGTNKPLTWARSATSSDNLCRSSVYTPNTKRNWFLTAHRTLSLRPRAPLSSIHPNPILQTSLISDNFHECCPSSDLVSSTVVCLLLGFYDFEFILVEMQRIKL